MKRFRSALFLFCAGLLTAGCVNTEDRERDDRLVSFFRSSPGTPYQFKAKEVIYDYNQVRRALLVRRDYMLSNSEIRENLRKLEKELQEAASWPFKPEGHNLPRALSKPVIDGDLSDTAWEKALTFKGEYPAGGTEKQKNSAVWKMMYDETYLYFAAEFPDADLRKTSSGAIYHADSFELFLLPEKRYWTYVELVCSPWNEIYTKWLHQTPRGRIEISDYSPKSLSIQTRIGKDGWQLEGRIAFLDLPAYLRGGKPQSGETLYAMMIRIDKKKTEKHKLFVPVPFLPDGHNIYGYMKLTLE